jgi:hypothetical protein
LWAPMPFTLPLAILWRRAFINFPTQPSAISGAILDFVSAYFVVSIVAFVLTYALVRFID